MSERNNIVSFDVLASVDMLRFDFQTSGKVLPETWQRVFDEELTYIAEGIDRSLHTTFKLREIDGDLVYFDRGQWRPYIGTLLTGLQVARAEVLKDPRKTFQAERATDDLRIGYQLDSLAVGEKLSWYSRYPQQEEAMFGTDLIRSLGYNPVRKMGFIYQAIKNIDGSITLDSQSVDNSDEEAFESAMFVASYDEGATIGDMRVEYDKKLSEKYNELYFAGRKMSAGSSLEDAWEVIKQHDDLVTYFLGEIEKLAQSDVLTRDDLKQEKLRLTYGVWAALKERLDSKAVPATTRQLNPAAYLGIQEEVERAFVRLSQRGDVLVGCGGAISGSRNSLIDTDPSDVFGKIFGSESNESWTWKKGVCQVDNCPTRPGATDVGPCSVCRCCQRWFDKGRDPAKLYKGLRVAAKNSVTTRKSPAHKKTDIKSEQKV